MKKAIFKNKVKSLRAKIFLIQTQVESKTNNYYKPLKNKYLDEFNNLCKSYIIKYLDNTYTTKFEPQGVTIFKKNTFQSNSTLIPIAFISLNPTESLNPPFNKINIKIYNTEYSLEEENQKLFTLSKITKSILKNQPKILLKANIAYKKLKDFDKKYHQFLTKHQQKISFLDFNLKEIIYIHHLPKVKSLEPITLNSPISLNIPNGGPSIKDITSFKLTSSNEIIISYNNGSKIEDYIVFLPDNKEFIYDLITIHHRQFSHDSSFREASIEAFQEVHPNLLIED